MEKENKKAREDSRKSYNETVRVSNWLISIYYCHTIFLKALVKFIRKRDPRYKAYLAQQAEASQVGTTANVPKQDGTAALRRAQASENYVEQDWQKVDNRTLHIDLEWAIAEGGDEEEWECVACNKTFKSEAAWDSHERSKKHLKEVEQLQLQMREEGEAWGLEGKSTSMEEEGQQLREDEMLDEKTTTGSPIPTPHCPSLFSDSEIDTTEGISASQIQTGPLKAKGKERNNGSTHDQVPQRPLSKTERRALRRNHQFEAEENGSEHGDDMQQNKEHPRVPQAPSSSKRDKRQAKQAKETGSASQRVCGSGCLTRDLPI